MFLFESIPKTVVLPLFFYWCLLRPNILNLSHSQLQLESTIYGARVQFIIFVWCVFWQWTFGGGVMFGMFLIGIHPRNNNNNNNTVNRVDLLMDPMKCNQKYDPIMSMLLIKHISHAERGLYDKYAEEFDSMKRSINDIGLTSVICCCGHVFDYDNFNFRAVKFHPCIPLFVRNTVRFGKWWAHISDGYYWVGGGGGGERDKKRGQISRSSICIVEKWLIRFSGQVIRCVSAATLLNYRAKFIISYRARFEKERESEIKRVHMRRNL